MNILKKEKNKSLHYLFNLSLAFIIIFAFFYLLLFLLEKKINKTLDFTFMKKAFPLFLKGFESSLLLSFFTLFLSLILGFILNLFRSSKILFISMIALFFINITRGMPILVYIFLLYYGFFSPFNVDNKFLAGVIIISLFSSAYVAEIIRSGIHSIHKGQFEAGKSLGLNNFELYIHVIIPQALKIIIPTLTGQFASIIKDTSILSIISIREFTMTTREISSNYFISFEAYIPLAIGYLILTLPISLLSQHLERKTKIKYT